MRNKETGEFELVVGNGQLLSGFFILVLLLAVTFAMGYVVGQNSPRSAKVQNEAAAPAVPPETRPQAAAPAQAAAAPPQQPPADGSAPASPGDAPPQPTTQAAREPGAAAPASAPAPPPAETAAESPAGSYWQVLAVKESKPANLLADTLKERGYPASVQTGADGFVRVLVGPYADVQTMGRIKTELESRFGLHPYKK